MGIIGIQPAYRGFVVRLGQGTVPLVNQPIHVHRSSLGRSTNNIRFVMRRSGKSQSVLEFPHSLSSLPSKKGFIGSRMDRS